MLWCVAWLPQSPFLGCPDFVPLICFTFLYEDCQTDVT